MSVNFIDEFNKRAEKLNANFISESDFKKKRQMVEKILALYLNIAEDPKPEMIKLSKKVKTRSSTSYDRKKMEEGTQNCEDIRDTQTYKILKEHLHYTDKEKVPIVIIQSFLRNAPLTEEERRNFRVAIKNQLIAYNILDHHIDWLKKNILIAEEAGIKIFMFDPDKRSRKYKETSNSDDNDSA
ncbi:hypothetical protein TVAG_301820 [Trichomonas vaginalis G3]|uniref:Uncharacterized protein n=1 Tax=Trichomonas vaginalis (strain ATCC PRA-98 / G3) TaxID=412133 RepID=A2FG22_TRIV3|nr:hypothetical protein TVAGG3_0674740 [Trichomonas vaginalis G3]EAX96141.1 hypothetical protein TVAG_301820 [Trichomonas vaginalis G3]KAI5507452.1 hypothetical protein TVAGG3_0674740 [Trichomonas vaginalis G3]|eukprot:XP_001309071.1 hypothetical protein [Trichomonas vaginalis G3]